MSASGDNRTPLHPGARPKPDTSRHRRTVVTSRPFPIGTVTETRLGSDCRASAYAFTAGFEWTLSATTTPPGSSFVRATWKYVS